MKNTFTLEIAAPPEQVFNWISAGELQKQWIPNLVENEVVLDVAGGVGSTFRHVYVEHGRRMEMQGKITGFTINKYLACEMHAAAFDLSVDYTLEDLQGRTRLTQNSSVMFKSWPMRFLGVLLRPLFKTMAAKQAATSFGKLKACVEAAAAQ